MKIKINTNKLINGIVIGFVLLIAASWGSIFFFTSGSGGVQKGVDPHFFDSVEHNNVKPIDEEISGDLSYYQYNKLKDSIRLIRDLKNGDYSEGGMTLGFLGVEKSISCDTCSIKWFWADGLSGETHRVNYIILQGWTIKSTSLLYDSNKFYVAHNQAYIRKLIDVTPSITDKKSHKGLLLRRIDEPVRFRFNQREKCVMIPVSQGTERTLNIIFTITGIAMILFMFYLVACFLKFVVDLSKGLLFTAENVKRLKLIGIGLLSYPVGTFLINLLLGLIFHNYFSRDVTLKFTVWEDSWQLIVSGIVFLMLYKAFRQGKILKEEQDLVV